MKPMEMLLLSLVVPATISAQSSTIPQTATVRGLLEDNIGKKNVPASGFLVTLENQNYTSPAVRSGKDGLYYIPNLTPGNYTLKVWTDSKTPLSFPIVVNNGSLTDIAPVVVAPPNTGKLKSPATVPKGKKTKTAPATAKTTGAQPQK